MDESRLVEVPARILIDREQEEITAKRTGIRKHLHRSHRNPQMSLDIHHRIFARTDHFSHRIPDRNLRVGLHLESLHSIRLLSL